MATQNTFSRRCAGLYKLAPLFPHDHNAMFGNFGSPSSFASQALKSSALRVNADGDYTEGRLQLPCPLVDYIEPENIDLLITDSGGLTPSYIYRLLSELYAREDYTLPTQVDRPLDAEIGRTSRCSFGA
jgi:translation initiation factor eIF-2B subunit beta